MDDKTKEEYTVNGFLFGSAADVELGEAEFSTVKYIDKKIENRNADTILSVFQGAVERKMFRTPVGYSYLHDLQRRMISLGMDKNKIPPVPMYQVFNNQIEDDKPRRTVTVPKKKKRDEVRAMNRTLVIVNIVLVVIILALFAISMNGTNPNIINYRNVIQDEYATWEQELKEREQIVREKERNLNIDNSMYEERIDTE